MHTSKIKDSLLGLAVGDALGVPVEFRHRDELTRNPVTDLRGYGSHHVPAGTWSDDASLTFCLAEVLTNGFDVKSIAENFRKWLYENYWTPHGSVFDVGIATREAIHRYASGMAPELAGGMDEYDNGNGSLMRILPLVFYIHDKPIAERFALTKAVSSITHYHIRSVIGCFYYLEFARQLLASNDVRTIYQDLQATVPDALQSLGINPAEIAQYDRLLKGDIGALPESEIRSSGYVVHTLEASIWCLLTTNSYKDAVLKAVNLGEDTDTTGAVTGGLAGMLYGLQGIPESWCAQLARKADIEDLAARLAAQLGYF
ncbi:MAG: ADP-ribosylglycohydrolase family protein [Sphingobacteriales bacterium]|nr:MAG: ADP-ribosylglycohydrolase family protein [Sphingobacteriales bacterium]